MTEKEQAPKKPDIPEEWQALIAGFFPNTKYFDSRFDLLQVQIDELRRNQEGFKEQLQDVKKDMDQRFTQVDKRFEQVDKRFEQVDQRFQHLEDKIDRLIERIDVKVDSGLKETHGLTGLTRIIKNIIFAAGNPSSLKALLWHIRPSSKMNHRPWRGDLSPRLVTA